MEGGRKVKVRREEITKITHHYDWGSNSGRWQQQCNIDKAANSSNVSMGVGIDTIGCGDAGMVGGH
jgi:hypothetical protein